jgi:acyl-CoA synthetase (AMP-forming)/AMP-acid ligase II
MVRTLERAALLVRRDATLGTWMDRLERVHGGRRLVEEPDGLTLTHRQAAKRVRRWAGGIAARTSPGDVVVVNARNGYEQLLLCLAAARAGCLPAPVNDQMRREEIAHVVADSGATLVLHRATEVDGHPPLAEAHPAQPDEVAALFYTSGTTGSPKGVELTHRALVGQVLTAVAWPAALRRDEAVISLPVAHIMGFVVLLGLGAAGIPTYLLPHFNPVAVLDAIESRRGTIFIGVPAMYRMMEEAGAADRDLTSVRLWASGADAMPPELAQRFKEMGATVSLPLLGGFGQAAFAEAYGMVEVGGGVAAKLSPPFLSTSSGPFGEALGIALPGYDLRVVDEDGAPLPAGSVGELQVKGPGVLKGYRGDEAATAEVLTSDGWLRTGDLARQGPLGMLVFEGRAKHVIKHGGYSVYALEVEHCLEQHPDVVEASVIGLPDDRLGELPVAVVRVRDGAGADPEALVAHVAEHLAEYKVPKRIVIVDELPRTGTNKVQKAALLELFDLP